MIHFTPRDRRRAYMLKMLRRHGLLIAITFALYLVDLELIINHLMK